MDAELLNDMKRQAKSYDYIRFTWCDLYGAPRGQTVTGRNVEKFLEDGIQVYAACLAMGPRSQIPMLKQVEDLHHCNMAALPEPGTFHSIPWAGQGKYSVAEVLCETHWAHSGAYQAACPRTVARRQLNNLDGLGYSILSGFEMELKLMDEKTGKPLFDGCDVFNQLLVAQNEAFLFDFEKHMMQMGVNIEKIHTEFSPGQFEFCLEPHMGICSPDSYFKFKYGLKEFASRSGLEANFMTMADPTNMCGNSAHFNHSLWTKEGKNAFFDKNQEDNLSDVARYWIGGLLKHAPALTSLCSPTVNCYRRLHRSFVPDTSSWGIEDRISSLRVKNYTERNTYIENRMASSCCNPYLVLAGHIAAGMDGLVNRIECPPKSQREAPKIPFTLSEALEALESDSVMVEALGPEFVHWYYESKRQIDLKICEKSDMKVNDPDAMQAEVGLYSKYM